MGCGDSGSWGGFSNTPTPSQVEMYERKIEHLSACICALVNEIEKLDNADEIIIGAERNGIVNLQGFWRAHKKRDELRIRRDLDKYSDHEMDILKSILEGRVE